MKYISPHKKFYLHKCLWLEIGFKCVSFYSDKKYVYNCMSIYLHSFFFSSLGKKRQLSAKTIPRIMEWATCSYDGGIWRPLSEVKEVRNNSNPRETLYDILEEKPILKQI